MSSEKAWLLFLRKMPCFLVCVTKSLTVSLNSPSAGAWRKGGELGQGLWLHAANCLPVGHPVPRVWAPGRWHIAHARQSFVGKLAAIKGSWVGFWCRVMVRSLIAQCLGRAMLSVPEQLACMSLHCAVWIFLTSLFSQGKIWVIWTTHLHFGALTEKKMNIIWQEVLCFGDITSRKARSESVAVSGFQQHLKIVHLEVSHVAARCRTSVILTTSDRAFSSCSNTYHSLSDEI